MSKSGKIITGILSFSPLFFLTGYFILFFSFFLQMFMNMDDPAKMAKPELFVTQFIGMFALLFLMGIVTLGLLIYFIIHINNNKKLDSNEKLIWILIIIFVGMIGKPVYWYMKIWKDEDEKVLQ
jgi:hypothetical protein